MIRILLVLYLLVSAGGLHAAELRDRFPALVRADDPRHSSAKPSSGVRITYLGTHGYLFEASGAVLLVDPYFSRMVLFRSALRGKTVAQPGRINAWLAGVPRIDGIFVTHGHIDHLFDVP